MATNGNANAIPFFMLRRRASFIPPAIKEAMILWYDISRQGCTNKNMAANPMLRDLSGNGHDATCYNFAWSGMSGIGGYVTSFLNYLINNDGITISDSVIRCIAPLTGSAVWILNFNKKEFPQTKVKISNIPDGSNITYYYIDETGERKFLSLTNGEHELPKSYSVNTFTGGFYKASTYSNVDFTGVTIELIPQYPNALVSDGVGDYARFITFDLLSENKLYYIAKYVKIKDMGKWQYLLDYYNNANSVRYYIGNPPNNRNHYGEAIGQYDSDIFYGEAVYLYTDRPSYKLTLFSNEYVSEGVNCALYSLLLFNRTLTAEEIEWVKTNLIEAEQ